MPNADRPSRWIVLEGVREHNLRNVTVRLPHRALTVVTGVSGSGKSSLALDTLYAEGQRRFLEGMSAHSRRFLERLPRPDLDRAEGLAPAIAVRQRAGVSGPRSTVGTATEVADYLRLLFARIGTVHCDDCDAVVPRWTPEAILGDWVEAQDRLGVSFPRPVSGAAATRDRLRSEGYLRVVAEDTILPLESAPGRAPVWWVLQDRVRAGDRGRLAEAVEAALRAGEGQVRVEGAERRATYRLGRHCSACGTGYPDPHPLHFSFNSPVGACPECEGFGAVLTFDPERIVPDRTRSLEEGAVAPWAGKWKGTMARKLAASPVTRDIPRDVPFGELSPRDQKVLIHGEGKFPGALGFLEKLARKRYKAGARFLVKRYQTPRPCAACGESRVGPAGRRVRVGERGFAEWIADTVGEAREALDRLSLSLSASETVQGLLEDLRHRLEILGRVGLDYLGLDRPSRTLSGGETQRIELAQALGARLVDALYVLDEPTVGLHPRDTGRLLGVLRDLKDLGNTVVVVEHDHQVVRASDWMVDVGPGAGREGGDILYCGPTVDRLGGPSSPTTKLLAAPPPPFAVRRRDPRGWLRVRDACRHNLRGISVDLPFGVLVGVCGVSGSGKSTLVSEVLVPLLARWGSAGKPRARSGPVGDPERGTLLVEAPLADVAIMDQSPLGRSSRSIPASYVGAWTGIRQAFAAAPEARRRGRGPGAFSFNTAEGRCPECRGDGEIVVDMDFMADVRLVCEACGGGRFHPEVLGCTYRGLSIDAVLRLPVDRALAHFHDVPSVARPLNWLSRVGLGYLELGRSALTLSGGEAQRLKLVRELVGARRGRLFILDEPTVGLHGSEVGRLLTLFDELIAAGNSVLVIEHDVDVLATCDWLVELGPEGGVLGGRVVAQGTPEQIVAVRASHTAPYLRSRLVPRPTPAGVPG